MMDAQTFNSIMPRVNEAWAASVLNMEHKNKGIDLVDKDKAVEIKFNLLRNIFYNYISWKVQDFQVDGYANDHFLLFWGLGLYTMNTKVSKIKTKDENKLESMVIKRELYIVSWKWMEQFKPHFCSGETKISFWEHWWRYAKFSKLPKTIESFSVTKGIVHITKDVPLSLFRVKNG